MENVHFCCIYSFIFPLIVSTYQNSLLHWPIKILIRLDQLEFRNTQFDSRSLQTNKHWVLLVITASVLLCSDLIPTKIDFHFIAKERIAKLISIYQTALLKNCQFRHFNKTNSLLARPVFVLHVPRFAQMSVTLQSIGKVYIKYSSRPPDYVSLYHISDWNKIQENKRLLTEKEQEILTELSNINLNA